MAERLYTMKDVVDITGIPATTLLFYDKKGLLQFVRRSIGGIRIFTERDIALLRLIQFFRNVDMPIQEINQFLSLYLQGPSTSVQRRELIRSHLDQLKADVEDKEEKLAAASFLDTLFSEKEKYLDQGNLPAILRKKDIPQDMVKFFNRK